MKNAGKDLRIMAVIAGSGAVGVLATMLALVAVRGPASSPEPMEARQQAVVEASERAEAHHRIRVTGTATKEGATIRVRSTGSVFESRAEPIIYVDGVRVNGDRDEALQLLEPDQIDRIEVLKGDAAKELYGSEAGNGVIQIVTKSKEGS